MNHCRPAFLVLAFLFASIPQSRAEIANAWHIPSATQTGIPGTMRDQFVEVSGTGSFMVYTGFYKNNDAGGDQNGGFVFCRKGTSGSWSQVRLDFFADVPGGGNVQNQFWRAEIKLGPGGLNAGPNDVIQYYIRTTYSDREDTYLYGGDLDGNNQKTTSESVAQNAPYSFRNRPAWIFHANNRVLSGNNVSFWAKVGYVGDVSNNATRWADSGAVYFTTDGTTPAGSLGTGTGTTQVALFNYDHPETPFESGGSTSVTGGKGMWWVATANNLLQGVSIGATVKYKVGFWHTANSEEKFGDFNAGTSNQVFSFTNGTLGEPALTITSASTGTLPGSYTTTKVFVDEVAGDPVPLTIDFAPGENNVTEVEVVTNLNQRDFAEGDKNANAVQDGMEFNQTASLIGSGTDYYYRSYPVSNPVTGHYSIVLNAAKTGAYRLTARWKVSGDPNWRWFTNHNANRRDHAITVSPVTVRDMNLYEINTLTVEAKDTSGFIERSTFEDLYDASGAPRTDEGRAFNLDYLVGLGVNWLWFQPIHPPAIEGRETDPGTGQPYNLGSPYAVKNFFEVNPWMSKNYNGTDDISSSASRAKGMASFQGFVAAADTKGVGVMLDAPFNHGGFDIELAQAGIDAFQRGGETWSPSDQIKNREGRFFSKSNDYGQRASGAADAAVAPDRGDFGKWSDVKDIYFGRYDALVNQNPSDNGNYLNEGDRFYYAPAGQGTPDDPENSNWTADDDAVTAGTQNVTEGVWKYFARYAVHWLEKTRPAGQNRNSTSGDGDSAARYAWDNRGIDGLRCDFGQGLPPQCWEYIINVARSHKWTFAMMAESLDGGAVTYRSNRHFDVLNENIVFPLKSAGNTSDFKSIFEGRRGAYGQGLVLMNSTSHDEENYENIFHPLLRYYLTNTMDGVPLIFMGQELGVTRTSGFSFYETNFGKNIAHFKKFNSMQPAWVNRAASPFGEKYLFDAFASVGQARRSNRALRSSQRYFLDRTAGGLRNEIWAVAKYEQPNVSPNLQDVVFAFVNLRTTANSDTFNVNITSGGTNLFGLKSGRTYNVKNIAAYKGPAGQGFPQGRRDAWLWGANGRSGSDVLGNGVFVSMNTLPVSDQAWKDAPYEAQYLKVYDITPPPTGGAPATQKPYAIGTQATFSWSAASDPDGGISGYHVVISTGTNGTGTVIFDGDVSGTSKTVTAGYGQTLYASVKAVNNAGVESSSASNSSGGTELLDPEEDRDGDGMTNSSEDFAGSNPLDNQDVFAVSQTSANGNQVAITWRSVPGHSYQVEMRSHLESGSWSDAGVQVTAGPGETSKTQMFDTGGGPKFYRVRAL